MKILAFTHAEFEGVGCIADWARERGHELEVKRPFAKESIAQYTAEHFDMLVIMGGPQSPAERETCMYLEDEIDLIKKAIEARKIIIGFCLGAQLIGEALGAKTERSPMKEFGVHPVQLTQEGKDDRVMGPLGEEFNAFHWHNDMPGIAEGGVLLAKSPGCPRQAVRYGEQIYGLQFHLEVTQEGYKDLVDACPGDLDNPNEYTQTAEAMLDQDYKAVNQTMYEVLDRLVAVKVEV